ncbi:MAG TPA: hypothetical protein VKY65_16050 [Alphaproteobacteria bacterium]|nr:hypothetical protein [Alphaproteobacteria bacterium]
MRISRLRLAAAAPIAGLGLLLVGCANVPSSPELPPPGSSPGFQAGYVDGCWSGFADAGRDPLQLAGRKDEQRFQSDADYRSGFPQGYAACFREEKLHPRIHPDGGAHV